MMVFFFFFFNDTATTEIYTLSLHDALPISVGSWNGSAILFASAISRQRAGSPNTLDEMPLAVSPSITLRIRSEEHTSELQSQSNLVCRLLLEKKKKYHKLHSAQSDQCHHTP